MAVASATEMEKKEASKAAGSSLMK